ncbi:MAG: UDP-glucose/GDP-mannose dehydrogenase family protein [bacterium]|nr:UDP-glucose/GDP-mannose dehydrogenase family protein [bacterium]
MKITIIGTGFVGVVSAAVYASFGHDVYGLDIDPDKVAALSKGKVPFFEPDLEKLLIDQQKTGSLRFTTVYSEAVTDSDVVIIAVGTPSAPDGQADLKYVLAAAESLAPFLKENAVVAIKSTVPPGTLEKMTEQIKKHTTLHFYTASLPEFLREGTAVYDTLNPDRVVIGADDEFVFDTLEELHKPLKTTIVKISPESAQMAKYSANAYLATRITFINQIADLCQKNGADIQEVIAAISSDRRIGSHYWYPGFGYGGSCFPKDVSELAAYSRSVGEANNLFNKVYSLNSERIDRLMNQYGEVIHGWESHRVAVLGLSFKPNTDDMREAPSIKVINYLLKRGVPVKAFDPKAIPVAKHFLPKHTLLAYEAELLTAVNNASVILALIEWPEITQFDFSQVRNQAEEQWFIDARNQFSREQVEAWGFNYLGIGR